MKTVVRLYRARIITVLATSALLIATADVGAMIGLDRLQRHVEVMINGNMLPVVQLNELRAAELQARRRFWKTAELRQPERLQEALEGFQTDMDKVDTEWSAYYPRGISSPREGTIAEELRQSLPKFKTIIAVAIHRLRAGQYTSAMQWFDESVGCMDYFDTLLADDISTNADQAAGLVKESKTILKWMSRAVISFLTAFILLVATLTIYLLRQRDNAVVESRYQSWLTNRVFELTLDGMMVTDAKGHILHVNQAFSDLTGYSAVEVVGGTPKILNSGRQTPEFYCDFWTALKTTGQWKGQLWNRRKCGDVYLESLKIAGIRDGDGRFSHYVAVMNDITQRFRQEERLSHLATHDALTGLPNRMLFSERLKQAIIRAKRHRNQVAVMYIDLDGFKQVNDTRGHGAGDEVLRTVAGRLTHGLRESDTVARLGGDEFAIVLEDIAPGSDVKRIASSLVTSVGAAIRIGDRDEWVTPSIGISMYPGSATDAEKLVEMADHAMYLAKKDGKNGYRIATESPGTQPERVIEESIS
ncbi:hypothetical protein LMG27952_02226 [Paraburkholderia hiiakae]|uniref:PAS domain S-box-containing protein/diguanylate cyclase (GGDEF)-like protein n=1 Tax=Paraburkholderia hiiakae TaxID=1081782 RepID=A0ABM8NJK7_9BURK|nr:diguanylate cyclase [Paraburkholderia hiiakae]CAD6528496.1 hypothetical protein LMG27952_02226 [Paraburkholderia hiiakae]